MAKRGRPKGSRNKKEDPDEEENILKLDKRQLYSLFDLTTEKQIGKISFDNKERAEWYAAIIGVKNYEVKELPRRTIEINLRNL